MIKKFYKAFIACALGVTVWNAGAAALPSFNPTITYTTVTDLDGKVYAYQNSIYYDAQGNAWTSIPPSKNGYYPVSPSGGGSVMTGATAGSAGTSGSVPAPIAGQQATVLRGNATWQLPWQPYTAVLAVSGATTTGGATNNYFPAPVYSQAGVAGWSGTSTLTVTLNTSGVVTFPTAGTYYLEFIGSATANTATGNYIFLNNPSNGLTIYNSTGAYLAQGVAAAGNQYGIAGASTVVATQSGTVSIGFGTTSSETGVTIYGGLKVTRVDSGL